MLNCETGFIPNCQPHKIIIVPDDKFQRIDNRLVKFTINEVNSAKCFIISPHRLENSNNTDLLRYKLFCEKKGWKLISYGSLNQLPFLSIFSDEVWLETDSNLSRLYRTNTRVDTTNGVVGSPLHYLGDFHNVEFGKWVFWKDINSIDVERVVDRFASMNVYIRKSSYDLFLRLLENHVLPHDSLWAEVKLKGQFMWNFSRNYSKGNWVFKTPVVGFDYNFQRKLLSYAGNHYMTIQLLSSLIGGNFFLCQAGSSNLFSVVPVLSLMLHEYYLYDLNLCRRLAIRRYGPIGMRIPSLSSNPTTQLTRQDIQLIDIAVSRIKPRYELVPFKASAKSLIHL